MRRNQTVNLDIGPTLRELREKAGISQDALAEKMGFKHRSSIKRIESGETSVSLEQLEQIARAIGQPPAALLLMVLKDRYPEFMESPYGPVIRGLAELVEKPT